jgi:hypothetical protein
MDAGAAGGKRLDGAGGLTGLRRYRPGIEPIDSYLIRGPRSLELVAAA